MLFGASCNASSWRLIDELARIIGGQVAASRAAVDAGLPELTEAIAAVQPVA